MTALEGLAPHHPFHTEQVPAAHDGAARRLGVDVRLVREVADRPVGQVVTVAADVGDDAEVAGRWLVTDTVVRRYVPEVDDLGDVSSPGRGRTRPASDAA